MSAGEWREGISPCWNFCCALIKFKTFASWVARMFIILKIHIYCTHYICRPHKKFSRYAKWLLDPQEGACSSVLNAKWQLKLENLRHLDGLLFYLALPRHVSTFVFIARVRHVCVCVSVWVYLCIPLIVLCSLCCVPVRRTLSPN